jgi:hypothetical protein
MIILVLFARNIQSAAKIGVILDSENQYYVHPKPKAKVSGQLMIIASVPYDERHVAAVWSQFECFTAGIDKLVLSVPLGSQHIAEPLVLAAQERLGLEVAIHYFPNTRYDVGLWCDALVELGYNNITQAPFENTILLNDSVFALRHFNSILETLQDDKSKQLVSLSYSYNGGSYWLESVLRGFSRQGIPRFLDYSCQHDANHSSFGSHFNREAERKHAIVSYHEIGLARQYPPNTTTGLFSADAPDSFPRRNTWVRHERLWKWLKDEHGFPVAKMNQPYAIPSLGDPIAAVCTSKMDKNFLQSLNFTSFPRRR